MTQEKFEEEKIPEGFMKRDHVAVILEGIRSENRVFADGLKALSERMDQGFEEVFQRLDRHGDGIADLRIRTKNVENRLTTVEESNTRIEKRLTKVEESNTGIEKRLTKVEESNTRIEKRLTKVEESNTRIENRLTKVENSNDRIEADIRLIKNNLKVKVDLEEFQVLETRVVVLEKKLATLAK